MLRLQLPDGRQGAFQRLVRLLRYAQHEIQRQVVKACLPGLLDQPDGVLHPVLPAEGAQHAVVCGLHADTQPIYPRLVQNLKVLHGGAARVTLHRALRYLARKGRANPVQQRRQPLGAQQQGRAAAKVHRAHRVPLRALSILLYQLMKAPGQLFRPVPIRPE